MSGYKLKLSKRPHLQTTKSLLKEYHALMAELEADCFNPPFEDEIGTQTHEIDSLQEPSDPNIICHPDYPTDSNLDADNYLALFNDQWHRFTPNEHYIGHALIDIDDPSYSAKQFNPPVQNAYGVEYTPINSIRLFNHQGQLMAFGVASDGTPMLARRSVEMHLSNPAQDKHYNLLFFSPIMTNSGTRKHLGDNQSPPLLREDTPKGSTELKKTFQTGKIKRKGGDVTLDRASIEYRGSHKRSKTQKKVMGKKSADTIIHRFYQKYQSILSEGMKSLLDWVIQQKNEWTHALGYRISPLSFNPQVRENLVAGPAWLNTKMNVSEKFAQYHAEHGTGKTSQLTCHLDTFPGSDVISQGAISASVQLGADTVTIAQELKAWVPFPIYSQVSDIPQSVLVSEALLEGHRPYIVQAKHLGEIADMSALESALLQDTTQYRSTGEMLAKEQSIEEPSLACTSTKLDKPTITRRFQTTLVELSNAKNCQF